MDTQNMCAKFHGLSFMKGVDIWILCGKHVYLRIYLKLLEFSVGSSF